MTVRFHAYVGGLLVVLVALGAMLVAQPAPVDVYRDPVPWIFAVFIVVGDLFPITLRRRSQEQQIAMSTPFAYAFFLQFGLRPLVFVWVVAALASGFHARRPLGGVAGDVGRSTLAMAVAAWVLGLASDGPDFAAPGDYATTHLATVLVAGMAFMVVRHFLHSWTSLPDRRRWPIGHDVGFHLLTGVMQIGFAPVIVLCSTHSIGLVPLLALPLVAVYRSAWVSLEKEHLALHDPLTRLPNRTLFADRVEHAIGECRRHGSGAGVMLVDLDRFKEINDTLGHHMGDELLRELARRFQTRIREIDTIARMGGDEFAVLVTDVRRPGDVEVIADRILAELRAPVQVDDFTIELDASLGIAMYPNHGVDVDSLLQKADVAMYLAKDRRGGRQTYRPERDPNTSRRLELLGGLRGAIEAGDLCVRYQPKVTLAGPVLSGAEALVRWQHPRFGELAPHEFIPLAEQTGLIQPLMHFVLDASLGQCADWRRSGLELTVAVNLSFRNLHDGGLPAQVATLLDKHRLDASVLVFELDEASLMADPVRHGGVLDALADLGVALSIDDFGTGCSSLAILRRLPIRELKIDRSFVSGIRDSRTSETIVRATVQLAQTLGLRTVAEGVESGATRTMLTELGCTEAQGFYFSRPLPGADVPVWAQDFAAAVRAGLPPPSDGSPAQSVSEDGYANYQVP